VSNTNLRVVGSMQGRQEGVSAAQAVIEQVLSSIQFTRAPAGRRREALGHRHQRRLEGGLRREALAAAALHPRRTRRAGAKIAPADLPCVGSAVLGKAHLSGYCSDTVWEITATTQDKLTGANTTGSAGSRRARRGRRRRLVVHLNAIRSNATHITRTEVLRMKASFILRRLLAATFSAALALSGAPRLPRPRRTSTSSRAARPTAPSRTCSSSWTAR
jgi:hypothetical protein